MNINGFKEKINSSIEDFLSSFLRFSTWKTLGYYEVKQRYQRSTLGPWWVTISMLIFVIVIGGVFSKVFSMDHKEYMPYFCSGYLVWIFISTCISESTDLFKSNSGYLKQINLPLNLYIFKFLTKNTIIFFHNFIVLLLVFSYFKFNPGFYAILAIPGFFLLLLNLYWISLFVGLACTRFRDLMPIVNSLIQILFLVTPISWKKTLVNQESVYIKFNPLVYIIDILREPLLGHVPTIETYLIVAGITCIGFTITLIIFSFCKYRLTFWVD